MRLGALHVGGRTRTWLIGTCAVLVALVAIAFAVGGSGSAQPRGATSAGLAAGAVPGGVPADGRLAPVHKTVGGVPTGGAADRAPAPNLPVPAAPSNTGGSPEEFSTTAGGTTAGAVATSQADSVGSDSSLGASRIVKTGNLTIRVAKSKVKSVTEALTSLATAQGGYVSQSNSSLDTANPYGEVVLRIPVAHFQDAIDAAEKLGDKVVSLTTSADDVTGKFVDLTAKKRALERTRQTYLAILSRARTIGATLAVQQRVDDVQQQIDELHGRIKVLANQSSYSTLTVSVVPVGGDLLAATHHQRHGIGKAWHDSWSRFGRGVNAIVGAIGPIVFAVLLLGLLALIGYGGYRGVRRAMRGSPAAS
ncbi:MAG TPA: DUF4349 domain-containing protein [Mycobacteriales bacterium]|nr:DUF4349 domain-containing protein [Mycobacteriales bacterium]